MVARGVIAAADDETGSPSLSAGGWPLRPAARACEEPAGQAASASAPGARRPPEAAAGSQAASWTVM